MQHTVYLLIRDFVLLTLELATVGMEVVWIDPRPGSGFLSSVARSRECQWWSDVEVWWPDNWESEQSVVAINVCCPWWLSQIWGFLVASPHPTELLPLRSGRCSRLGDVTTSKGTACMNARLPGNSPASGPDFMLVTLQLSSHLAPISPSQT